MDTPGFPQADSALKNPGPSLGGGHPRAAFRGIVRNSGGGERREPAGDQPGNGEELRRVAFADDASLALEEEYLISPRPLLQRLLSKVRTLSGHSDVVYSVALSPDGKLVVSGSEDHTVKIWHAETGAEVLSLVGHADEVRSVSFSPDGKRVVSGSYDKLVKIWNAETGVEIHTLGHSLSGKCTCHFPWETNLTCLATGHADVVLSVSFSPDGKRVVSGSNDTLVKIWNAETGQEVLTLMGHSGEVTSVAFSADGTRVVSGSSDNLAVVWNAETGTEVCRLSGHTGEVTSVSFSPDGTRVVSGSSDSTVKIWHAETGAEVWTSKTHDCNESCICRKRKNRQGGKRVVVHPECPVIGHSDEVHSVAFSPDGKRVVSGSEDMLAKIWNAETGSEVYTLTLHSGCLYSVVFSPDGKRVVSGSSDNSVLIWDDEIPAEV